MFLISIICTSQHLLPQRRKGYRGEIGGVYLPPQLERIHHNFAQGGRDCRVKGGGRAPPLPGWTEFTIMME